MSQAPEVGQIWLARPDQGPAVPVLVVEVHPDHVLALLCDEEWWRSTESDSVLVPQDTGCAHPLLVHGDLAATVLIRRLWRSVGRVEPELAARVALRGRRRDFSSGDLGRGTPRQGDADPRWIYKEAKARELRTVRARASELGWQVLTLVDRDREPAG